jgi:hypothetical protein
MKMVIHGNDRFLPSYPFAKSLSRATKVYLLSQGEKRVANNTIDLNSFVVTASGDLGKSIHPGWPAHVYAVSMIMKGHSFRTSLRAGFLDWSMAEKACGASLSQVPSPN